MAQSRKAASFDDRVASMHALVVLVVSIRILLFPHYAWNNLFSKGSANVNEE